MQKLEISCRSGRGTYTDLSPAEETDRLQEIDREKTRQAVEGTKAVKQRLAKVLAELREMKQNKDVFDDEDISEKQGEVDGLKAQLSPPPGLR